MEEYFNRNIKFIIDNLSKHICGIPRQTDQAESLIIFKFSLFNYFIDGYKKLSTLIFRFFQSKSVSTILICSRNFFLNLRIGVGHFFVATYNIFIYFLQHSTIHLLTFFKIHFFALWFTGNKKKFLRTCYKKYS